MGLPDYMTIDLADLPEFIKIAREESDGMTQQQAANVMGLSPSALSHYETGARLMSSDAMTSVLAAYGYTEVKLLVRRPS